MNRGQASKLKKFNFLDFNFLDFFEIWYIIRAINKVPSFIGGPVSF
jgi:hypothetical protein